MNLSPHRLDVRISCCQGHSGIVCFLFGLVIVVLPTLSFVAYDRIPGKRVCITAGCPICQLLWSPCVQGMHTV